MTTTAIICDNSDYAVVFDFDEEWSEFETLSATLSYYDRERKKLVTLSEELSVDATFIPSIQNAREVFIGLTSGTITAKPAMIPCLDSIFTSKGKEAGVEVDPYNVLMAEINSIVPGGLPTTPITTEDGEWLTTIDGRYVTYKL